MRVHLKALVSLVASGGQQRRLSSECNAVVARNVDGDDCNATVPIDSGLGHQVEDHDLIVELLLDRPKVELLENVAQCSLCGWHD